MDKNFMQLARRLVHGCILEPAELRAQCDNLRQQPNLGCVINVRLYPRGVMGLLTARERLRKARRMRHYGEVFKELAVANAQYLLALPDIE